MSLRFEPEPSPAMRAEALRMYLETTASLRQIATFLKMSRRTLERRIEVWGWPPRPPLRRRGPCPADLGVVRASVPAPAPGPEPQGLDGLARRLERLVTRRIDLLEAEAAVGRDPDPERTDRRLVQLERLLAQLSKRRSPDAEPDDTSPPARSVAELRDELLRHLERMRQQARAGRLRRRAEPDGAAAPAASLADPDGAPGPDPA